ncbi:hypothetical protein [Facklamia sp. P12932]|uniref:hypothetical protein n=1 Tax=Facklamia sp. P12932 TaxID=3421947 RepID=UPI003D171B8B
MRTKDISATNWEIILLLLIGIIYLIGLRSDKELFLPTSFSGKKLTIGKSKQAKMQRVKSYLIESLIFSVVITGICLFFTFLEVEYVLELIVYIIEFFGLLLVSFMLNYSLGEYKIKKYKKHIDNLDN